MHGWWDVQECALLVAADCAARVNAGMHTFFFRWCAYFMHVVVLPHPCTVNPKPLHEWPLDAEPTVQRKQHMGQAPM